MAARGRDVPTHQHVLTAEFWGRALRWPVGPGWLGHPELRSFEPPAGTSYLHLQEIDGPPRVHLDLEFDHPDATIERAIGLGAELVAEHDRWTTLVSPGGLSFCVLRVNEHQPPEPMTWPDEHRSRMVQICIDSPQAVHQQEVMFWRALLPGRWVDSVAHEFAGKWNPTTPGHRSSCSSSVLTSPTDPHEPTSITAPTTCPPRYVGCSIS